MNANSQLTSILDFQLAPTEAIESVLFEIETVWFGIPLSRVERIVDVTNIHNDFSALARVEPLDLHELLFGCNLVEPKAWTIYRAANSTLYGIPSASVPTLVNIPFDRIRQLPIDFRTTTPLNIASHVACFEELTALLLVD